MDEAGASPTYDWMSSTTILVSQRDIIPSRQATACTKIKSSFSVVFPPQPLIRNLLARIFTFLLRLEPDSASSLQLNSYQLEHFVVVTTPINPSFAELNRPQRP